MEEDKDALFERLEDLERKCGSRAEDLRRPGPMREHYTDRDAT